MRKAREFKNAKILQEAGHKATSTSLHPPKPKYRARLGNPVPVTEFQLRMRNWIRACRWIRATDTNYTFPAYRFARSPIGAEIEYLTGEAITRAPEPIDWEDAWEVELTWRGLPIKAHWVIKMDLHLTKDPKHACRLMRRFLVFVHHADWDTELEKALLELELELDMGKSSRGEVRSGPVPPVISPRPGFPLPALYLVTKHQYP